MLWIAVAAAALFEEAPGALGPTGGWTNEVLLDDLDGDGDLDLVLVDGGDYASAGEPVANRVLRNLGGRGFEAWALPGGPDLARSAAVGDVDGDGWPDLLIATTWQTASRLFLGGPGGFVEASDRLPREPRSFGDVALGDVDLDGDLDVVLVDWGPGNPLSGPGAVTRLWRNDGGVFTDVTDASMPDLPIGMSWDLELADVDGDFDLDALIASKPGAGSALLLNDGTGRFTDASERLPAFSNNYAMAPMDLDGDGDLDLATLNDGNQLRNHLLLNDGDGWFTSGNGTALPGPDNPGADDNAAVWHDLDDDGQPDLVIASLSGADRALFNDDGVLRLAPGSAFAAPPTPGTLALAIGDLDGDGRPDALMGQGEAAFSDHLYFGVDVAIDTRPPVIVGWRHVDGVALARVHDRATPVRPSDLRVTWEIDGEATSFTHAGGDLWRAAVALPGGVAVGLCAEDRSGNRACASVQAGAGPEREGCGCDAGRAGPGGLLVLAALAVRRRRGGRSPGCRASSDGAGRETR